MSAHAPPKRGDVTIVVHGLIPREGKRLSDRSSRIRIGATIQQQIEHGAPVEAQSFESRLKHLLVRAGMSSRQGALAAVIMRFMA